MYNEYTDIRAFEAQNRAHPTAKILATPVSRNYSLGRCAGTGYIKFDEFCCVVCKKMQDDEDEKELRDMFRILDKEKKGEVNTNELRYATVSTLLHDWHR